MQWSNIDTRISTRRGRSARRSVQSSPNRSTSSAKPRREGRDRPPSIAKATRMKNLPVSASSNCAASVMSPPCRASRVATAATMPGRLSQRKVRTWAVIGSPWLEGLSARASKAFRKNCTIGSREVRGSASTAGADEGAQCDRPQPGMRAPAHDLARPLPAHGSPPGRRLADPGDPLRRLGLAALAGVAPGLRQAARADPRRRLAVPAHARRGSPASSSPTPIVISAAGVALPGRRPGRGGGRARSRSRSSPRAATRWRR